MRRLFVFVCAPVVLLFGLGPTLSDGTSLGGPAAVQAAPASKAKAKAKVKKPASSHHVHIHAAIKRLHHAKHALTRTRLAYGSHRMKALLHIDHAIHELRELLRYLNAAKR